MLAMSMLRRLEIIGNIILSVSTDLPDSVLIPNGCFGSRVRFQKESRSCLISYVCMHLDVCMHECVRAFVRVCVCMYVCMYVCMNASISSIKKSVLEPSIGIIGIKICPNLIFSFCLLTFES